MKTFVLAGKCASRSTKNLIQQHFIDLLTAYRKDSEGHVHMFLLFFLLNILSLPLCIKVMKKCFFRGLKI